MDIFQDIVNDVLTDVVDDVIGNVIEDVIVDPINDVVDDIIGFNNFVNDLFPVLLAFDRQTFYGSKWQRMLGSFKEFL